jgi:hypothetical protein
MSLQFREMLEQELEVRGTAISQCLCSMGNFGTGAEGQPSQHQQQEQPSLHVPGVRKILEQELEVSLASISNRNSQLSMSLE